MVITLITGISGSGKSVALRILEDSGYFCVDNLPPSLLYPLVNTRRPTGLPPLAVAIDVRSADSLASLPQVIEQLRGEGHHVEVIFLTAKTQSLIARFSETRRAHPLSHRVTNQDDTTLTLTECIEQERAMLVDLEALAHTIDTSDVRASQLSAWIKDLVGADIHNTHAKNTQLIFESFGFKHGVPLDADFIFDVRMLANPHYDAALRPLTGRDPAVVHFLNDLPETIDLLHDIRCFIEKWLPAFKQNHRPYLTVAIGCTGGQHRSVFIAEQLAAYFESTERVVRRHRELLP